MPKSTRLSEPMLTLVVDKNEYRIVAVDDFAVVQSLVHELEVYHDQLSRMPSVAMRDWLTDWRRDVTSWKQEEHQLYALFCNKEPTPVGFVHVVVQTGSKQGVLRQLFVQDKHRKHGLGAALAQCGIKWLQEHADPNQDLTLTVSGGNESVLKFYAKLGFDRRETHVFYRLHRKFSDEVRSDD